MTTEDVTIIAPAHNEEALIKNFLKEVVDECQKLHLKYRILVIENGSSDLTYQIVQTETVKNPYIKVIMLKTAGYGLALKEGLKKADGKFAVIFNVDFWDRRFLELTKIDLLGYDIILGSKLLPGSSDHRPFSRKVVSYLFSKMLLIFFNYRGTDTHGIKALRMDSISKITNKCQLTSGIFDSELMIRASRDQLKILELPVNITEIRANRFGIKRIIQTPKDLIKLYKVLH